MISGVTHYQFTDSDAEDLKRKCVPQKSLDDAHAAIRSAMVGFFDAALGDGGVGEPALRAVPGVTVDPSVGSASGRNDPRVLLSE